jgi:hypothetical protein
MDYLGRLEKLPTRLKTQINTSRSFYENISFNEFENENDFNFLYSKLQKTFKENGKCIIEDSSKNKYIIELEKINCFFPYSIDISICGLKKIK